MFLRQIRHQRVEQIGVRPDDMGVALHLVYRCPRLIQDHGRVGRRLQPLIPTVSLGVTYAVVYIYGYDGGRIWPTRCAVIDAGLDDRYRPRRARVLKSGGIGRNQHFIESNCGLQTLENETILCPWDMALIALVQLIPPDFSSLEYQG